MGDENMLHFPGRDREIIELSKLFSDQESTTTICITGETGIGKTSLARKLFEITNKESLQDRFEEKLIIEAYLDNWEHVITELAREMLPQLPSKVTYSELETEMLKLITNKKFLILIDNIDQERVSSGTIVKFVKKWTKTDHKSLLLLTIRTNPFHNSPIKNCLVYELQGITDSFTISYLLGPELVELLNRENMRERVVAELGNNPQKLLYLRWQAPKNKEDLEKYIQDLKITGKISVETVLQKIPYPLTHFLAISRLRDPEFDETLLAFLWDRLGGGSTEIYVRTLQYLLDEKLLILERPTDRWKFRLSAGVHVGLNQPFSKYVSPERVVYIDHFISEYYRNEFAKSKEKNLQLKFLEHYVYYALKSGNFYSAYVYIFESDILDVAHNFGLSLELEPILLQFDQYWKDLPKKSLNSYSAEQGTRIKIELGRVYKDLSKHVSGLQYLREAEKILEIEVAYGIKEDIKHELKRNIWHVSAISSSDLGDSKACLNYYFQIVEDAINKDNFTWFDALSMGYLAHELKFYDIEKAAEVGKKALDISDKIGHQDTKIKNLCSLGQTLFFMNNLEESKKVFKEAEKLCIKHKRGSQLDLRELGRLYIHSAMIYIVTREWEFAEEYINKGLDLNKKFGDRRRAASAHAYLSIMLFNKGDKKNALNNMLLAIQQHIEIDDWRNLVNEIMSYIFMTVPKFNGNLHKMKLKNDFPLEVKDCVMHIINNDNLEIFVDFWKNYFKPIFFGD